VKKVGVIDTAAVLNCPFDLKERVMVVSHSRAPTVATGGIVLGIKQSKQMKNIRKKGKNQEVRESCQLVIAKERETWHQELNQPLITCWHCFCFGLPH
jgi:hypothetical protein